MNLSQAVRDDLLDSHPILPPSKKKCEDQYSGFKSVPAMKAVEEFKDMEFFVQVLTPLIEAIDRESGGRIRLGPGFYAQCKVMFFHRKGQMCAKHKDRWKHFLCQYEDEYDTYGMVDMRIAFQWSRTLRSFHPWEFTMMSEHPGNFNFKNNIFFSFEKFFCLNNSFV